MTETKNIQELTRDELVEQIRAADPERKISPTISRKEALDIFMTYQEPDGEAEESEETEEGANNPEDSAETEAETKTEEKSDVKPGRSFTVQKQTITLGGMSFRQGEKIRAGDFASETIESLRKRNLIK